MAKSVKIYETKGNFITYTISCLLVSEMQKYINDMETNYLPSAIRRHISTRSSVVMEPHNSLIASENLSDDRPP